MIRFAVIGTNWITRQFVDAAHETGKYKLTAVYSRSLEQAQSFANDYRLNICSPHSMRWRKATPLTRSISPARMLCTSRKRSCSSAIKACDLREAAGVEYPRSGSRHCACPRKPVVLFEAFKTASLPNFLLLQQSLPKIGKVRKAFINYCQYSSRYQRYLDGENPNTFNPAFSNGSIMDIGFTARPLRLRCGGTTRRDGHRQPAGERRGCTRRCGAGLR